MRTAPDIVARLSARVFLGKDLARDPIWLKISVQYTIALMFAVRELRMCPHALRPYVHWFLPACFYLRRLGSKARKLMSAEVAKRKVIRQENLRNGIKNPKVSDTLGWMMDLAKDDPNFGYADTQLGLTFAAIHTTSDLLTKCIYNFLTYPKYIEPVRKEMIDVLSRRLEEDRPRLEGTAISGMARVAEEDVKLSDGTVIPKDASVKMFLDKHYDGSVYPNPEHFDGYRFLNLRNQPGQENNWQFVTTSAEHAGFGHGMQACPGRFFASNEVKIALVFLLLRYDFKLADENKPPKSMDLGMELVADPITKVMYRRREEELDLFSSS
ncbi:cytochrome P450 monooxygenase [Rhizodiscina lignyota]|uniref:Cytochrome P450 monooxygenase n=1 Tax=Rhizodiscina lignyota TaxID=1504668 RepID=A0A9P4MCU0_9PEZI|nr:cytochrome P450 monooxygenase [Rhizodiscina lignyota]